MGKPGYWESYLLSLRRCHPHLAVPLCSPPLMGLCIPSPSAPAMPERRRPMSHSHGKDHPLETRTMHHWGLLFTVLLFSCTTQEAIFCGRDPMNHAGSLCAGSCSNVTFAGHPVPHASSSCLRASRQGPYPPLPPNTREIRLQVCPSHLVLGSPPRLAPNFPWQPGWQLSSVPLSEDTAQSVTHGQEVRMAT